MRTQTINEYLFRGKIDHIDLLPHFQNLQQQPYIFNIDFGLKKLPTEPGILIIRGARQYGKSTWLEQQIYNTIQEFGAGSAFYLNGEYILDMDLLEKEIENLINSFTNNTTIRRIFIDEITAIPNWEIALKRLSDRGKLRDILLITTGSKATDLRRGTEKLPGRTGKLDRVNYLFTPVSYKEFHRVCNDKLGSNTLNAYIISGREAALSNNSIASGYIEILNDLGCVIPAYPWDQHKNLLILRKPCKYHFTNLLVAVAYHPMQIRRPQDMITIPEDMQGSMLEWLIAQELTRRAAIQSNNILEPLAFWQNKEHEIDFVDLPKKMFLEIKRGSCSPLEFSWFYKQFPNDNLIIINKNNFRTKSVTGIKLEEFLLDSD